MSLDTWKKLVAAPVAQLLKPRGFRKAGLSFSAACPGVTLLVALQSSTGSTRANLQITCNVAVRLDQLATGPRLGVWDAHWRLRIGFFLSSPHDHWWPCTSDEDARCAGQEIAALLESPGLPVLEGLASPAALAWLWSSGRSPGLTEWQRAEYLARLVAAGVSPAEPEFASEAIGRYASGAT